MEQQQPKLSKYAAKQARLANDQNFGTEYIYDHEAAAKNKRQALDKIIMMQIEIGQIERHIESLRERIERSQCHIDSLRAHIEKLQRAIERQKELLNAEEA